MRISAISVQPYNRTNFKGVFISQSESHEYYDYKGEPSGTNPGHYMGYEDSSSYIYYPFKDESEAHIQKVLEDNNYLNFYDPEMTGGFGGSDSCSTTRGKTLPYTEKEWNRMSEREQDKIRSLLK